MQCFGAGQKHVFAEVGELGVRMDALLQTQTKVHKEVMSKLQTPGIAECLDLYPDRMVKVLSSANVTAGVDPEMALSSLVPAFLLEVQAKEELWVALSWLVATFLLEVQAKEVPKGGCLQTLYEGSAGGGVCVKDKYFIQEKGTGRACTKNGAEQGHMYLERLGHLQSVSRLRATEGTLRAQHAAAVAQANAIQATMESERASDQTRQQHVTALVSMLRDQVGLTGGYGKLPRATRVTNHQPTNQPSKAYIKGRRSGRPETKAGQTSGARIKVVRPGPLWTTRHKAERRGSGQIKLSLHLKSGPVSNVAFLGLGPYPASQIPSSRRLSGSKFSHFPSLKRIGKDNPFALQFFHSNRFTSNPFTQMHREGGGEFNPAVGLFLPRQWEPINLAGYKLCEQENEGKKEA
eukprot:1161131-Pelagomonas_calceolata.AAC.5